MNRMKTDRTLEEYMQLPYRMELVEDREEGGYAVSFPDLPGCISCGSTIENAVENGRDAKEAWLRAALEDGIEIQEPGGTEAYSGQFKLRIPKCLHRELAETAKKEGISMNQYCLYLLSRNVSVPVKPLS